MSSSQRPLLTPQYIFRFACIGSECEDTCCKVWRVQIDEATYKRYRRLRHPELRPLLDKAVKRNRSNPTPRGYAKLKLDENGFCPLLSPEGLCRIHSELGPEYLATLCAVYPRVTRIVDGILERSLTLSCPEAARTVLLNPDPMEFEHARESADVRNDIIGELDTSDIKFARRLERHFWEVRSFVIELLQNRLYAVWERLVLLGLFMQKLEQLKGEGFQSTKELIRRYHTAIDDGTLRESLASVPAQTTMQIKFTKELIDERFRQPIGHKVYLECLAQVAAGLEITRDATDEAIGRRYQTAYTEYYAPFMSEREYIFENYLVNYVFKNAFPLGPRGPFGEYVMLVVHYALVKMLLIGMAAFHKGLNEELVIKLVYSFSRVIEHSPAYLARTYKMIEESGLATMPYMAILIKN